MLDSDRPKSLQQWLAIVDNLAAGIRMHKPAIERDCRLPDTLLAALAQPGLFRMWLPSELGGHDVEPEIALQVIEAVSRIDGSTGWCLGPGNVSSLFSAYLPPRAARDVYGGNWLVNAAGSLAGMGQAFEVAEGYRLSGRWSFCTNSFGCPWYLGVFRLMDGDRPRTLPDGKPDLRIFFFPASSARIVPTWDTGGLRGTASNDIVVESATVGKDYGFSLGAPSWPSASLYASGPKLWAQTAFAAVAAGIAHSAIETLAALCKTRIPTMGTAPLRDNPVIRDQLGRADAAFQAARIYFYECVRDCTDQLSRTRSVTREGAARLGQACSLLGDTSRETCQTMYRLGGGASVYKICPLDQCLRDVSVATQHASLGQKHYDEVARVRLDLPAAA